jgi:uncharacterized cupin superfamily protein
VTAIVNLLDAEGGEENDRDGFRFRDRWIGHELGAEVLGCSLYDVLPGQQLWPYHYHLGNEEWLVVVSGTPTLRTPAGFRELSPGDIVAFPVGEAGAHTVLNRTGENVGVAIFSTLNPPTLAVYPDGAKVGANRRYYRVADAVDYWDGETGPV